MAIFEKKKSKKLKVENWKVITENYNETYKCKLKKLTCLNYT